MLPHKLLGRKDRGGQVGQATRSPLLTAAQALGAFHNLVEGESKNPNSGRALRYHREAPGPSHPACKKGAQPKFGWIDKAVEKNFEDALNHARGCTNLNSSLEI